MERFESATYQTRYISNPLYFEHASFRAKFSANRLSIEHRFQRTKFQTQNISRYCRISYTKLIERTTKHTSFRPRYISISKRNLQLKIAVSLVGKKSNQFTRVNGPKSSNMRTNQFIQANLSTVGIAKKKLTRNVGSVAGGRTTIK